MNQRLKKIQDQFLNVIILAAGNSVRMKSQIPKSLHSLAGLSILGHIIRTVLCLNPKNIYLVIAPYMTSVKEEAKKHFSEIIVVFQDKQNGTAKAVLCASEAFLSKGQTMIICGDTPLVTFKTLSEFIMSSRKDNKTSVLSMSLTNGDSYGRLILNKNGIPKKIIEKNEEISLDKRNKKHSFYSTGIFLLENEIALKLICSLTCSSYTGEFNLSGIVNICYKNKIPFNFFKANDSTELKGINNKEELAQAEFIVQERLRNKVMLNGVTLQNPHSIFLSYDSLIESDVIIEENVHIGLKVEIASQVHIKSFSYLEGVKISSNVIIGPFAYIRPKSFLNKGVRIGSFVEVKNSHLNYGSKAKHLAYIGDTIIGKNSNIGAGTVTCNYDGHNKWITVINSNVFIGCNTSIVAPILIGDNSIIGAGSVITKNVPTNNLVVARVKQKNFKKFNC